jgi:hypothetical protein
MPGRSPSPRLTWLAIGAGRRDQPLLPLRLFRSASLSAGTVLVVLLMFAMFGAMFFMTFYLENVHGLDPVGAGVRLLPMSRDAATCQAPMPPTCAGMARRWRRCQLANSRTARAAAHGAHSGTSISPSGPRLYRRVITASSTSQAPRSSG